MDLEKTTTFMCRNLETLNGKWSRGSGYLTSQTAQSLEALASVKSSTKSAVFDMAFFTCLTTVKKRDRERSAGSGRWKG